MMREMDFVDEYYADKDLSLLKKLTLVIPTYNRNYYLSRCLWYHAHFPFGEIIVADSSPEEKKVVNRETVQKIREMFGAKIRYLEYEPETEKYGGDIYRKWGDAVQHVETEYSIISIDKAFVLPETLSKELTFLEKHEGYSSTSGMWYWIDKDERDQSKYSYFVAKDYRKTELIETPADPKERYLLSVHDKIPWLLFSIFRAKIQKDIYNTIQEHSVNDIRFAELSINILGNIYARTRYFPDDIDLCRDVSELNRSGTIKRSESSSTRYPFISDYIREGTVDKFYSPFSKCLKSALKTMLPSVTEERLNTLIDESKHYIVTKGKKNRDVYYIVMSNGYIRKIWELCPKVIKKPIREIMGYSDVKAYVKYPSSSLIIIEKIISRTQQLHKNDEPIEISLVE